MLILTLVRSLHVRSVAVVAVQHKLDCRSRSTLVPCQATKGPNPVELRGTGLPAQDDDDTLSPFSFIFLTLLVEAWADNLSDLDFFDFPSPGSFLALILNKWLHPPPRAALITVSMWTTSFNIAMPTEVRGPTAMRRGARSFID